MDDLKIFKCFFCQNFKRYEHYEKMLPKTNQPGQLYGTTKNIFLITLKTLLYWHWNSALSSHNLAHTHVMLPKKSQNIWSPYAVITSTWYGIPKNFQRCYVNKNHYRQMKSTYHLTLSPSSLMYWSKKSLITG